MSQQYGSESQVAEPKVVGAIELLGANMAMVKHKFPDWYEQYEDVDPMIGDRATVEALLNDAPTDFARGLIAGILIFRQSLAIVTGREF